MGIVDLDWGWEGAARAAAKEGVVVIVDVLRFSTSVAAHVAAGAEVEVISWKEGTLTQRLSPLSAGEKGRLKLSSLNGAQCTLRAASAPRLYAGALVNASAVARAARAWGHPITVVACGERWRAPGEDGALRFALEDLLGAGAVIAALRDLPSTSEAKAARAAFLGARKQLLARLLACESGRELTAKGQEADVCFAAQVDGLNSVPLWNPEGFFSNETLDNDRG